MKQYWEKNTVVSAGEGMVASGKDRVDVTGKEGLRQVRCVLPAGIDSFPSEGDEVVLLPLENGESVILGIAQYKNSSHKGIRIQAGSGGAYLQLNPDGTAEINRLLILPDGSTQQKEE